MLSLLFASSIFGQCGTETVTNPDYCANQNIEIQVSDGTNATYEWFSDPACTSSLGVGQKGGNGSDFVSVPFPGPTDVDHYYQKTVYGQTGGMDASTASASPGVLYKIFAQFPRSAHDFNGLSSLIILSSDVLPMVKFFLFFGEPFIG